MDNDALSHGQLEPLFHFLTDEDISSITGLNLKTLRNRRSRNDLAPSKRLLVDRVTYSGKAIRISKNFTHVDDLRAWLEAGGRTDALAALDKLLADKLAASPEQGE